MEKKKSKKKKNKNPSIFKFCILCVNPESENSNNVRKLVKTELQTFDKSFKREETTSTDFTPEILTEPATLNTALSQAYTEKIENKNNPNKQIPLPSIKPMTTMDREQKDQLVKAILSKYLAMKREEMLNIKPEESKSDNEKSSKTPRVPKSEFLSVVTKDSSEVIKLGDTNNEKTPTPRANFPIKCRSAPTNSVAHDSLADICRRFKQQDIKSESSDENCKDTTPKKLELIFNHSSEETSSFEENSIMSLQYKISCERTPGSLKDDSLSRNGTLKKYSREMKLASQELYLHPTIKGELGRLNSSTSSLKWKLIISHHGSKK